MLTFLCLSASEHPNMAEISAPESLARLTSSLVGGDVTLLLA